MRNYFIAGNWKMHKTTGEAVELAKALVEDLKDGKNKYMIAPPFTALDAVSKVVKGTNVMLGAQNMSTEEQGAHTGEVSVLMLKDLGVQAGYLQKKVKLPKPIGCYNTFRHKTEKKSWRKDFSFSTVSLQYVQNVFDIIRGTGLFDKIRSPPSYCPLKFVLSN